MASVNLVLPDLLAESADLEQRVAPLSEADWRRPTPAAGWDIAHQIAHLAWTDQMALLTIDDPAGFAELVRHAPEQGLDYVDRAAVKGATQPPDQLLRAWRSGRSQLAERLTAQPEDRKLVWFGPPMSPASMATARLMETWAHGQDVADALGQSVRPTERLRQVARLAVRTRDFAFRLHDLPVPEADFRVELIGPDDAHWTFGPQDVDQRVTGSALDFCLVAAQRRHRTDVDLRAVGAQAERWLQIMQVFAGPPGSGRATRDRAEPTP